MNTNLSPEIIETCRERLLQTKGQLMNRFENNKLAFDDRELGGDEADQSVSIINEHNFVSSQNRLRHQLLEIEQALARIENGRFGLCEETEEYIETDRLLALPWTRLSIEGAEIREALKAKYAR